MAILVLKLKQNLPRSEEKRGEKRDPVTPVLTHFFFSFLHFFGPLSFLSCHWMASRVIFFLLFFYSSVLAIPQSELATRCFVERGALI
jgi:hypothetical protein